MTTLSATRHDDVSVARLRRDPLAFAERCFVFEQPGEPHTIAIQAEMLLALYGAGWGDPDGERLGGGRGCSWSVWWPERRPGGRDEMWKRWSALLGD